MSDQLFVPADFAVPEALTAGEFRLEPLGPQHNAADYAAWTASIDHILGTPGFAGWGWPHEMSPAMAEFPPPPTQRGTGRPLTGHRVRPPRSRSERRDHRRNPSHRRWPVPGH
jgi:hypothetical protein